MSLDIYVIPDLDDEEQDLYSLGLDDEEQDLYSPGLDDEEQDLYNPDFDDDEVQERIEDDDG
jgi:hypothetical protein